MRASGDSVKPAIKRLFGPMVAGLVIDAIDLATFGAIGAYSGMLIGGAVGYWLAPELGFPPKGRWLSALMTGVYCTLPLTGFIPAATIAAGLSQVILQEGDDEASKPEPAQRSDDSIEAEYTSDWSDLDRP